MNEAIPATYIQTNVLELQPVGRVILTKTKAIFIFVGGKIWRGLKRVWQYLVEQNELAAEHHRALQMAKDEFYVKNYWCIR